MLEYFPPEDPADEWRYDVVCDFMHLSHNFHPVNWDGDDEEEGTEPEVVAGGTEAIDDGAED